MRSLGRLLACYAAGIGGIALGGVTQFNFTVVVLETDPIPNVGNVVFINNLAVNNNGEWLVEVDTDGPTDTDAALVDANGVVFQEGQGLLSPAGAILDGFDGLSLTNAGDSGQNLRLDPFPIGEDSGIYFNDSVVLQEGTNSTSPDFSPGTPYIGFFDAKLNNNNQFLLIASIDDPAIDSSVDRAMVILDTDGAGNLTGETVIAKESDVLPGMPAGVDDFETSSYESALNDSGQAIFLADIDTGSTADDSTIWLWDGANLTLLAREGDPAVIATRTYGSLSSNGVDINNNGDYVIKVNLENGDDAIIVNGAPYRQVGDTLPDISPFVFDDFRNAGSIQIDDNGNILWAAEWTDPDTAFNRGLFYNDQLIIQEGASQFLGLAVTILGTGEDNFVMSDNGRWAMAEVTLDGGLNAAVLIEIIPPSCPGDPTGLLCDSDLDGDCIVNNVDLGILLASYLASTGDANYNPDADFDGSGAVNNIDLGDLLADYLNDCN